MNTNAKIEMKIDNLIDMLQKMPADKVIMVPQETIDLLEKLSKGEELPESDDEESEEELLDDELFKCDKCGAIKDREHHVTLSHDNNGNTICDECVPEYVKENGLEDSDDEEEEDGDWDGDLEDTPNCHECGEDCGRTIVSHEKYKNTYFCSQKCQRKYDGEQDDFTNRMCENPECKKEFDLADPHYYDEDQGVCYCCEECSAV